MESQTIWADIYCRISSDPEGKALGVGRQEEDCRALAERLGVKVRKVWIENDVGASTKSKKPRPKYKAMLRDASAGKTQMLLSYSNSRITRRPLEWEELIKLHELHGTAIITCVSGRADFATADGRAVARTIAAWDAAEAERTAERVKRAKDDAVARGEWRGGRRPFGYESDGVTVKEDEARALEKAADAIIAGRSLRAVTKEMTDAGFTTTSKKALPLDGIALRAILLRPRNAGLLEVTEKVKGPDGKFVKVSKIAGPAQWPAIIPEEKWLAVRGILTDPARRTQTGSDVRWLGSGRYRCGLEGCGDIMRSTTYRSSGRGELRRCYRCRSGSHLIREQQYVDDLVTKTIAEYLRRPDIIQAFPKRSAHRPETQKAVADLTALRKRRTQLADDYADGLLDGTQLKAATVRLDARIAEAEALATSMADESALASLAVSERPDETFLGAPIDEQRAIMDALVTVTILPAPRGRPKGHVPGEPYFDPEYVRFEWNEAKKWRIAATNDN